MHDVEIEARLTNLGNSAYVFPDGGLQIRLPKGFKAFESRAVMTDQRLSATEAGLAILPKLALGLCLGYGLAWFWFREVLFHPGFPVDIRHNSKIGREELAEWAEKQMKS